MEDWQAHAAREAGRYRDGGERLPDDPDQRQRQLTRMGNAAYGAGLAYLMARDAEAGAWFERAAEAYRQSWEHAPSGSWGRPIGAVKARLLAGDWDGAAAEAEWTLAEGAAEAESPIGRYAASLALIVLGRGDEARPLAEGLREADFPGPVADALVYLATEDPLGFDEAVAAVLDSFESRDEYLEDVPVADTVLVLQALAARRGMAVVDLASPLLPRG